MVAAKTVVTTRPSESTIGPPEFPDRTAPRSDVIERRTGPWPYASCVITSRVAPIRPARTSYGPLPGKPRIAADVPDLGEATIDSASAFRPGTRRIARSFLASKETASASSPGWRPRSSTRVSFCPATTCALVTTSSGPATQPDPSTPSPHALPRIFTTESAAATTPGARAMPAVGAGTRASGPSMRGNGSSRASASISPLDGGRIVFEVLQDRRALDLAPRLAAVGERQRAEHPRDPEPDDGGQHGAQRPVDGGRRRRPHPAAQACAHPLEPEREHHARDQRSDQAEGG